MRFLTLIARNLIRRRTRTAADRDRPGGGDRGGARPRRDRLELRAVVHGALRRQGDRPGRRQGRDQQPALQHARSEPGAEAAADRGGGRGCPVADGHRRLRAGQHRQRAGQWLGERQPALPGLSHPGRSDVPPRRGPRGPARPCAGAEPRQEGRRRPRRGGRAVPGRRDLRERQPVRERRHGRAAGDAPADDGPRGPGHGLRDPGPVVRSRGDRRAETADRTRDPGRRRDPRARPRGTRRAAPARQGDGLGHRGRSPWCSDRWAC